MKWGIFLVAAVATCASGVEPVQADPVDAAAVPITCPQYGQRPAGCILPPLRHFIRVRTERVPPELAESRAGIVRPPRLVWQKKIPATEFPASLLQEGRENTTNIRVMVTVSADDKLTGCVPLGARRRIERAIPEAIDDPVAGREACELVLRHLGMIHAINSDGRSVEQKAVIAIDFDWLRYEEVPLPIIPPPAGAVIAVPGDWLPLRLPNVREEIVEPRWQDFLTDRAGLPEEATVGAALYMDGQGVSACKVGLSSGNASLDQATCAALLAENGKIRFYTMGYPLRVHWAGETASLELPREPLVPDAKRISMPATVQPPPGDAQEHNVNLLMTLDGDGRVIGCEVTLSSTNDTWDARSCEATEELVQFRGARNAFGEPTLGTMKMQVNWNTRTIRPGN